MTITKEQVSVIAYGCFKISLAIIELNKIKRSKAINTIINDLNDVRGKIGEVVDVLDKELKGN